MESPRFRFRPSDGRSFRGALLVVGVPPAPGYVARVGAHHLIESLGLAYAGSFASDDLPPAVVVCDGKPLPALRVHLGRQACGLDGRCEQLAVLVSEHTIPEELQRALAEAVVEWATSDGVEAIVVLDGIPSEGDAGAPPCILGVGTTPDALALLDENGIKRLDGVTMQGVTAALLAVGAERRFPVSAIFVEAEREFRDAGAAATLIEAVSKYVLHVPIDPAPLRERAQALTERMQTTTQRSQDLSDVALMYG